MVRMKLPDRRYLTWGAGLIIVAALPVLAGFTTLSWEIAEILGLAATLACLALCGCPVRPRESTPPVLLSVGRHEALGWLALAATVLHVLAAVAADHTVVEYFKFTSPLYQLAGIAAFLVLLVLVGTSLAGARRRLWSSHRNFQATHIAFACLMVALLGAHVIATGRYTGGYGRRLVFIAATAGAIAMLLRRRRGIGTAPHAAAAVRRLAFGRHSTLIAGVVAATAVALSVLIAGRAGVALREPVLRRAQTLPLNFDHGKHVAVNCLVCHHNYADGRGFDACIHCHRSVSADLKVGVEARFHSFCLNCHRNPEPRFPRHGPVSGCESCHSQPEPRAPD
jgi:DMSO/TMAO reductase YedYZ heme-binding membrane subunit